MKVQYLRGARSTSGGEIQPPETLEGKNILCGGTLTLQTVQPCARAFLIGPVDLAHLIGRKGTRMEGSEQRFLRVPGLAGFLGKTQTGIHLLYWHAAAQ